MNNDTILAELKKPFHPSQVTWKPGMTTKDGTKALALAYADLRAYQNRLDEICGLDWAVTYTPWGDKVVCHITIAGVTRSSTGEADGQSERNEIAGTSAEAQAFKRACAMFGLGRYLYALPSVWVEYDAATKQFTDKAKAKLEGVIVNHYRRTVMTPEGEPEKHQHEASHRAETEATATQQTIGQLRSQFDALGQELYGDQWTQVSRHNIERITGGKATESGALTTEQIQKLVDGMKGLQRKRAQAPVLGK